MGVNTIEREGVSFTHPANFILVGTMNPEEGSRALVAIARKMAYASQGIDRPYTYVLVLIRKFNTCGTSILSQGKY